MATYGYAKMVVPPPARDLYLPAQNLSHCPRLFRALSLICLLACFNGQMSTFENLLSTIYRTVQYRCIVSDGSDEPIPTRKLRRPQPHLARQGPTVASPRLRCLRVKLTRRCRALSPRRSSQQQWRSRLRSSAGASKPVLDLGCPNLAEPCSCGRALLLPVSPWSSPWRRALFCCLQHRLRRPDWRRDGQRRPAHLNEDEGNGWRRRASGLL